MLSAGDELIISGLDPETKAAVDRYIAANQHAYRPDEGALRARYEQGYRAGVADAKAGMAGNTQTALPLESQGGA